MTHRRQARGGTTAHDKVHMRAPHGHQGIRHLVTHHREAACFMRPHGYRLTCLGASLSVPAPHGLRTANLGPLGPCARVVVLVYVELSYGLPLVCIPSSRLLRFAWQQLGSCIVNVDAGWPHTVPRRRSSTDCTAGVCPVVSGLKMGPSANDTIPSPGYVLQGLRPW